MCKPLPMRKVLAIFLAIMLTLGLFAVAASATGPTVDRLPTAITNRIARYEAMITTAGFALEWHSATAYRQWVSARAQTTTQFQFNRAANAYANRLAEILRDAGELSWSAALFSWLRGQLWWPLVF